MRAEPRQDLGSGGRTGRPRTDPEVRFWTRVTKTPTCWLWQGAKGRGYGRFKIVGRHGPIVQAHRFAYEVLVGPIPSGFQIDHLCRVRHCVNPEHMEIVTQQENMARGEHHHRSKTHCANGHEFSPENTRIERDGHRSCRACDRARYYRRTHGAVA